MDNVAPHHSSLCILIFPDIVKLYTCLFFYDYLCDLKTSTGNYLNLTLLTEQHRYCTCNAYSEQLYIPSFRTNIRKFCPTIIGRYNWNGLPISFGSRSNNTKVMKFVFQHHLSQF